MRVRAASRFGLLLGAFLILTGLTFWDNGLADIYACVGARVCFYLTADESLAVSAFSGGVYVTRNGGGVIVDVSGAAAAECRKGFSDIKGESVSFQGDYRDAQKIIGIYCVKIIFEETLPLDGGPVKIIYGFSRTLTRSVSLDGKKVNIQIAVNGGSGTVTVGTPLILGSF